MLSRHGHVHGIEELQVAMLSAPECAMSDTKLYKVIVGFEDGVIADCDAVEYQGAIWLVPNWLPFPNEGYGKPERMIRLDQFPHRRFDPPTAGPPPFDGANFGINEPIPRALFDGELSGTLKDKYVVLQKPDARFSHRRSLTLEDIDPPLIRKWV
jgi:hypothetical protein